VDGSFQLTHSNGNTDFSKNIFTFGGVDPYIVKFEIEYSQTELIFKPGTYGTYVD
jgi:hypothetical protein